MPYIKTKIFSRLAFVCFLLCLSWQALSVPNLTKENFVLPKVLTQEQAFVFTATSQEANLILSWQIAPDCYLYQKELKVSLLQPDEGSLSILPQNLPEAEKTQDQYFGEQAIYHARLSFPISLAPYLASQGEASHLIHVSYQGCSSAGFCYPPEERWLKVHAKGSFITKVEILSENPHQKAGVKEKPEIQETAQSASAKTEKPYYLNFLLTIGSFYFLGMLLSFTPCILPMIPIMFTIIVGEKHLNTKKAFSLSLCYALSMAITYALAGIVAGTLGKNLQATFQHPVAITIFALLFLVFGLMQLGVIRLSFHQSLKMKEILSHLHAKQESGTYIGAAVMGILATLISSPCITPPFLAALGLISKQGDVVLGGLALLFMGFGIGTVLIFLGTVGGKVMPKSGPWMLHVNHFFAVAMFALSLWLLDRIIHAPYLLVLWGILCLFTAWCCKTFEKNGGILSRFGVIFVLYAFVLFWGAWLGETNPLKPLTVNPWQEQLAKQKMNFQSITSLSALEHIQEQVKKTEQPLLVVFHADWCASCKSLERNLWRNADVQEKLKSWRLVKVDVTANNAENQALMKKFGLYGPPAILFFDSDGDELSRYRIIGPISVEDFLNFVDQVQLEMKIS